MTRVAAGIAAVVTHAAALLFFLYMAEKDKGGLSYLSKVFFSVTDALSGTNGIWFLLLLVVVPVVLIVLPFFKVMRGKGPVDPVVLLIQVFVAPVLIALGALLLFSHHR